MLIETNWKCALGSNELIEQVAAIPRRSWAARNRNTIIVGLVLLIVFVGRWPALKGMWYGAEGAAAGDRIPWRTDYSAALTESAKSGKPILLDFSATWCPPCQTMKRDAWPDRRVGDVVRSEYIPVALDADLPATAGPARRYSVETIPRVLIVNSNGDVLRDASYLSADDLFNFLKSPPR